MWWRFSNRGLQVAPTNRLRIDGAVCVAHSGNRTCREGRQCASNSLLTEKRFVPRQPHG
jgi:hypothetical protein